MNWTLEKKIEINGMPHLMCDHCHVGEYYNFHRPANETAREFEERGWTINPKTGSVMCGSCHYDKEMWEETEHLRY